MITAADAEFHPSDPAEWRWTETTALIFSVPEERILGNVYVAARPNLGVALSAIAIGQGFCRHPFEIDFSDSQMHLPCPPSFVKYELENGLRVDCVNPPREYHFQYEYKLGGCSLDLTFKSLHEPFDAEDPKQNPMLETETGHAYDQRLGDQWGNPVTDKRYRSGHYEMIGHITGEIELRGKRYKVDCYEAMDHSFSRRTEVSKRAVSFLTATLGPDYALHLAVPMDVRNGDTAYDGFRFGYVVEEGQLFGIVDADVKSSGEGLLPLFCEIRAVDTRGKVHEIQGSAIAGHPWYNFNPSHVCFQSLMRWQQGSRVGYSEMANIFGLKFLAERLSRHKARP